MQQAFAESFYLTGAVLLGIGLIMIGILLMTLFCDVRSYYQVRGVYHREKWTYSIDKIIKYGKPDDNVDEENYFEIWFRSKDQAEAYLFTLQIQHENRKFKQTASCNT